MLCIVKERFTIADCYEALRNGLRLHTTCCYTGRGHLHYARFAISAAMALSETAMTESAAHRLTEMDLSSLLPPKVGSDDQRSRSDYEDLHRLLLF
jgi:hypothetical protein